MAETQFKTIFKNHKLSFKHKTDANKTILSKYIWYLEENKHEHKVDWSIVKRTKPYVVAIKHIVCARRKKRPTQQTI